MKAKRGETGKEEETADEQKSNRDMNEVCTDPKISVRKIFALFT